MKKSTVLILGLLAVITIFFSMKSVTTQAAGVYQRGFNFGSIISTASVSSGGTVVVSDTNVDRVFLSLVNSGTVGVSCYPTATSTGQSYGGGWYLAPNGGAITFDSVVIYDGPVSCIAASGGTTLGVVEN